MKIKTIGIIGNGQFGKLMHEHLKEYFKVRIYDKKDEASSLVKVCQTDAVIFAIPAQSLVESCKEVSKLVSNKAIIMDVTSVKVRPLEILKQYFPDNPILGTHPIFGPQSFAENRSIAGLPIVLTNVSVSGDNYRNVKDFLIQKLKLKIIEKSADEHDKEMAMVQGLSHFIGRALKHLDIKEFDTSTYSYKQLIHLKDLLKEDSWELFETIQNENPYASEARKLLLTELNKLEDSLQ